VVFISAPIPKCTIRRVIKFKKWSSTRTKRKGEVITERWKCHQSSRKLTLHKQVITNLWEQSKNSQRAKPRKDDSLYWSPQQGSAMRSGTTEVLQKGRIESQHPSGDLSVCGPKLGSHNTCSRHMSPGTSLEDSMLDNLTSTWEKLPGDANWGSFNWTDQQIPDHVTVRPANWRACAPLSSSSEPLICVSCDVPQISWQRRSLIYKTGPQETVRKKELNEGMCPK